MCGEIRSSLSGKISFGRKTNVLDHSDTAENRRKDALSASIQVFLLIRRSLVVITLLFRPDQTELFYKKNISMRRKLQRGKNLHSFDGVRT